MLSHSAVTTMLPVMDMARARAFYEESLGSAARRAAARWKVCLPGWRQCAGAVSKAWRHQGRAHCHQLPVPDIAASIRELKSRGVVFEDYDFPDFKTVNHVCVLGSEKAAWFKDTEGNYLCLHEEVAPA
jgi:predicted enzyme related to lactoylglutathione lyase